MARRHVFLSSCFLVNMAYVLHGIFIVKSPDRFRENNGVLYFKIEGSLSNINPDESGMYWFYSRDRTLRKHFRPGVKFAYRLMFKKKPSHTLCYALLIIAGDVAVNRGPTTTTGGQSEVGSLSCMLIQEVL